MVFVAGQSPITVYTPHVPAGASESDAARFLELCSLARTRHCRQTGKESLQRASQLAKLGNSVFYQGTYPWNGKPYKILMPREVVVARILEQEGRMAAIPAGWLTVPPVVLKDPREPTPPVSTDSRASTQGDSAARYANVVLAETVSWCTDTHLVSCSDPAEVQRAAAFMAGYKSYIDLQEPGQYALYKNAVQEQIIGGSTICTCEDPLAKLAYIKANLRR